MTEAEYVAMPSDADTDYHDEVGSFTNEYPKHGRFGNFRRSTTAAVLVASMALFTDMVVYGIVLPILPLIVNERLKMGSTSIGFLFGCYAIGLLGATPIFAVLSDKYRTRKIPMLFGMSSLAICSILFGISVTYWQLLIARIAQGAAGGASWTLSLAMLADRFGSGPKLGIVMGTVLSANTMGAIIGPLIGGSFYQYGGYFAPFLFCAILASCCFVVILMMVEPPLSSPISISNQVVDENSIVEDELELPTQPPSFYSLISDWNIVNLCLAIVVVASTLAGLEPILPIHLRKEFDADASQIGFIFIAIAIPAFLSPIVGYISFYIGQRKTCGIGMVLLGVSTTMISLPNKLWLVVLPLLFFGTAYAIVTTPTLPLLGHYVTQKGGGAYGQIYALWNMAYSIGMFIGPVVAGYLIELFEFRVTLIIFGVTAIVFTPFIFVGKLCSYDRRFRTAVVI